jgi:hypothetical protein
VTDQSPAATFAWEFGRRHRLGLIGIGVLLFALSATKLAVREYGFPADLDDTEVFAAMALVPATVAFIYCLAVFTFGLEGDLAARQSMFPARLFTKPVSTADLVRWPMLYGAVVAAALWIFTRSLALWPATLHVPIVWPGILAVALLAWAQALAWVPWGLPGLRVAAVILCLTIVDTVVLLGLYAEASEVVMSAFLVPQVPLAWMIARRAVARARHGDVPDWRSSLAGLTSLWRVSRRRAPFRSPAAAQAWFEWRRNGWPLPVWVAILLPLELLLLWAAGPSVKLVAAILFGICLTPVIMAAFGAVTVSRSGSSAGTSYSVSPFLAARPLTSAQLIAAKLRMTVWSTALAWLLVLTAIPLGLLLSGEMPLVVERSRRVAEVVGTPRAAALLLLLLAGFAASTWKQFVQSLYVGLTGREWLIKGSVFVMVMTLVCIGPIALWVFEAGHVATVLSSLPGIFAVLACLKVSGAVWIAWRLYRERLVRDGVLVAGAAAWCAAVFALYAVFVWMLDTPHIPRHFLMLTAILAVPLTRLSAAPLALAWNRHR